MGLLVMGCNHDLGIYVGGYDGYFLLLSNMSWICSIMIYMYIYIYNPLRLLRICVFPIMQLNSNATLLRICPHFVLICFLPIWPSLWKPLYISMQPVYIIDYIETACLYNTILCDVNCILSKCFQVQLWGCPGKPKFQFHILSKRSGLYIYI